MGPGLPPAGGVEGAWDGGVWDVLTTVDGGLLEACEPDGGCEVLGSGPPPVPPEVVPPLWVGASVALTVMAPEADPDPDPDVVETEPPDDEAVPEAAVPSPVGDVAVPNAPEESEPEVPEAPNGKTPPFID
jgi:hypothetical protein